VRVPGIINGLFSPDEGFFPKYAGGLYTLNDTSCLIIGRGLAKNHIPRVFNRPELVCIDILPTA
jgi:predicted MPP superfamily phosphohydrolase